MNVPVLVGPRTHFYRTTLASPLITTLARNGSSLPVKKSHSVTVSQFLDNHSLQLHDILHATLDGRPVLVPSSITPFLKSRSSPPARSQSPVVPPETPPVHPRANEVSPSISQAGNRALGGSLAPPPPPPSLCGTRHAPADVLASSEAASSTTDGLPATAVGVVLASGTSAPAVGLSPTYTAPTTAPTTAAAATAASAAFSTGPTAATGTSAFVSTSTPTAASRTAAAADPTVHTAEAELFLGECVGAACTDSMSRGVLSVLQRASRYSDTIDAGGGSGHGVCGSVGAAGAAVEGFAAVRAGRGVCVGEWVGMLDVSSSGMLGVSSSAEVSCSAAPLVIGSDRATMTTRARTTTCVRTTTHTRGACTEAARAGVVCADAADNDSTPASTSELTATMRDSEHTHGLFSSRGVQRERRIEGPVDGPLLEQLHAVSRVVLGVQYDVLAQQYNRALQRLVREP